ncbi:MAG: twin-arginine translocation signal domain-containing protein, partial [Candidatus Woesearchaeota archaeon]
MSELTRRDFLKGASAAAVVTALATTLGCPPTHIPKPDITSSLSAIKTEQVVYQLPYNKVQAPENGCLIGFRKVYAMSMPDAYKKEWMSNTRASESVEDIAKAFNDPKWDSTISKVIGEHIEYYKKALDKKPQIFVMYETPKLFLDFPTKQVAEVTKR